MKKILLIIFLLPFLGFAQVTGDYRSIATGNWTSLASWQYYNGSAWVAATTYPGQNTGTGAVTIRDSHVITINTNITNSFTSLVIGSGVSGELFVANDFSINTTSVRIMSNGIMSFDKNKTMTFPSGTSFLVSSGGKLYAENSDCSNQTALYIGNTKVSACTGNGGGALSNFDDFSSGGGTGSATSNSPVCAGNSLNLTAIPPTATSGSFTYQYKWLGPGIYNPNFSNSAIYPINNVNIYEHGGNYTVEIRRNDGFVTSVSTNVVVNAALITPTNTSSDNVNWCTSTIRWDGSATAFFLDVATSSNFSPSTILPSYNNLNVGNVNNLILTGLSPNTTYYFRVRSSGSCGVSANSNVHSFTTMTIAAPSANPGYVSCNDWVAQWNGVYNTSGQEVDGYFLDVAIDNTFTNYVSGYQNRPVGKTLAHAITGLAPGGVYYYRVRANTACGTGGNSNVISFTLTGNSSSTPGTISGGANSICVGSTTTFVKDSNSWPSAGTWSVFNQTGSATITQSGVVTGVSVGTVKVVFTTQNGGCGTSTSRDLTITTGGTVGAASSSLVVCFNTAISPVTHSTSGYTGISNNGVSGANGLPNGVSASFASNTITISGTPTQSGTFDYSIPLTGGSCGSANATGTIRVNANNTITLSSASGTNNQTRCINSAIANITYTTVGATGATVTGLPFGVTGSWSPNVVTISGTPTASGSFPYTVTLTGGCGTVTATGSITVNPIPSIPTVGVLTQPNCSVLTGSVGLSGLPETGTWTINPTPNTSGLTGLTGSNSTTTTISGLTVGTTYTFTVTQGGCNSSASSGVVVDAPPVIATWNGSDWSFTPTTTTRVEFLANYSSGSNAKSIPNVDACSCYVKDNAEVTFNSGHTLNVINEVQVFSGSLTFENNASLVQVNEDPNINSGNIIYKRVTLPVNRYDFTYWSSPVADMTLGLPLVGLSPTTFFDKYFSYINVNAWALESRATVMKKGVGYSVRAPQTTAISGNPLPFLATFTGVPHNGLVTLTSLAGSQAHLLGNPYPSAIDADVFLNLNSDLNVAEELRVLEGTLYFWTHNTPPSSTIAGDKKYNYTADDYATYNRTGGVGTAAKVHSLNYPAGSTNFSVPTGNIAAGQGFFAPTKAGGNVVFNNTMRISGGTSGTDNAQFFKLSTNSKTTTAKTEKNRIWLNLTNSEGAFKQTLIGYITGATNDYEGAFDGVSYDGNQFVDFYSVNNEVNLAIQGRALPFAKKDSVALGYKSTIKGEFQISIDQTDGVLATQNIFLEDKDLKVIHDLKKEGYTFSTEKGIFNNRFVLRYADKNAVDEVIIPETPGQESNEAVIVSVKDGEIKINATVTRLDKVVVYDMAGRKLFQKNKVDANVFFISRLVWNHQALVVDVLLTDGTKHSKKIIN